MKKIHREDIKDISEFHRRIFYFNNMEKLVKNKISFEPPTGRKKEEGHWFVFQQTRRGKQRGSIVLMNKDYYKILEQ